MLFKLHVVQFCVNLLLVFVGRKNQLLKVEEKNFWARENIYEDNDYFTFFFFFCRIF